MKKILLLLMILTLIGCSSAEEKINSKAMKEIEKGNFTGAALLLRDAVVINPDYLEGMVNYRNIYPRAIEDTESQIKLYNKNEDYIREANIYEDMILLKEGLYNLSPAVQNKFYLSLKIPVYGDIQKLNKDAGVSYYNAGNTYEGLKLDRYKRREKFYLYDRGQELYPRYKDIGERMVKSLDEARVIAVFSKVTGDINRRNQMEKEGIPKVKRQILSNSKLAKITIFKEIPPEELEGALRNAGNTAEINLKDFNTIIKINIDSFSYQPTRTTTNYYTRYWTEKYYVMENNVKVARYRERSYTEVVYEKRNSSKVVLSYEMIDLEDGKTIGNGQFKGTSGDRYRWSKIRGNAPSGVWNGMERDIKSGETIIGEAVEKASNMLGKDVSNNI